MRQMSLMFPALSSVPVKPALCFGDQTLGYDRLRAYGVSKYHTR